MSGFSTGCSELRIIERSLSLCLISVRCNEECCFHLSGRGVPGGEGYPGGEEYLRESGIRRRALSGGDGYPREMGTRRKGISGREGYPGERGIRGRGVSGVRGIRERGKEKHW